MHHENILRYHGYRKIDKRLQIITDYLPGGDLKTILKEMGPFPKNLIKMYARQLLQALVYIHDKGKKIHPKSKKVTTIIFGRKINYFRFFFLNLFRDHSSRSEELEHPT